MKKQVFSIKRSDLAELVIGLGTVEWNDHHYAGERSDQQLSWLRVGAAWHLGGSSISPLSLRYADLLKTVNGIATNHMASASYGGWVSVDLARGDVAALRKVHLMDGPR